MSEKRKVVWESLLDAEMNARYWGQLARRYRSREVGIKIFLAITSSGTVAGWYVWASLPYIWQSLSALSALVATVFPFLTYTASIETMADLRGKWTQLLMDYELLWANFESASTSENALVESKLEQLKARQTEMSKAEATLPRDRKLIRRCQAEVRRSKGI